MVWNHTLLILYTTNYQNSLRRKKTNVKCSNYENMYSHFFKKKFSSSKEESPLDFAAWDSAIENTILPISSLLVTRELFLFAEFLDCSILIC